MIEKIYILTEAGSAIGLGHVSRCLAIKNEFDSRGLNVEMYVYVRGEISSSDEFIEYEWLQNFNCITTSNSLVIIDSYLADEKVYEVYAEKSKFQIAIDDFSRIVYPSSLIINPNVYFKYVDYTNQLNKVLGGEQFLLLRKEIIHFKQEVNNKNKQLLISLGGDDYRSILPNLIEDILKIEYLFDKIIVVTNSDLTIFSEKLEILPLQNTMSIYELFSRSNVVISNCGQTLNELIYLNTPVISICIDEDQVWNQLYYFENKLIDSKLSWDMTDLNEKIIGELKIKLNTNYTSKKQHVLDVNGVKNIVDIILKYEF